MVNRSPYETGELLSDRNPVLADLGSPVSSPGRVDVRCVCMEHVREPTQEGDSRLVSRSRACGSWPAGEGTLPPPGCWGVKDSWLEPFTA